MTYGNPVPTQDTKEKHQLYTLAYKWALAAHLVRSSRGLS